MSRQRSIKKLDELLESLVGDSSDVFVLFVDLCGSTEFKKDSPEATWIPRQLVFLQRAATLVKQHKGIVVKTVGDELIAIFQPPIFADEVVKCAIEILQSYGNLKSYQGKSRIEAKVSLDFGRTYDGRIVDSVPYDPIGTPVDRCARLNSVTGKNEITFSEDFLIALLNNSTREHLSTKYGYTSRQENFKGLGEITVYSIITAQNPN
jgi:adenylate cyclase